MSWQKVKLGDVSITDELLYNDLMAWNKQKNKYQSVFINGYFG